MTCSHCDGEFNEVESTYCGSFCWRCLQIHLESCEICRSDLCLLEG